ncbi:MAG TPA: hypothetical protein VLY82_02690 [Nitrososphaerales archaeon]|nr:hypothetical protein [Nitrososphaerales archaeon]
MPWNYRIHNNEPVSVEVELAIASTDQAILIRIEDGEEEIWIPKSQIHADSEVSEEGDSGTLIIPRWLAREKGIEP